MWAHVVAAREGEIMKFKLSLCDPEGVVPKGYKRVVAFVSPDNRHIAVPCQLEADDKDHNCDREACGTFSHVISFWRYNENKEKQ